MSQDAQTRTDLLAAADLLERDGWCQKTYRNAMGQRCVIGALDAIAYYDDRRVEAARAALQLPGSLTAWNDTPGRTQAEVVALLREAAAR